MSSHDLRMPTDEEIERWIAIAEIMTAAGRPEDVEEMMTRMAAALPPQVTKVKGLSPAFRLGLYLATTDMLLNSLPEFRALRERFLYSGSLLASMEDIFREMRRA